jgi:hypothetical protein
MLAGMIFDTEHICGTVFSVAAPVTVEWLARVGKALDGAGDWRPTRGGSRDPGRTKVPSTAAAVTTWFNGWNGTRDGMWFFSDDKSLVTGRIDAYALDNAPGKRAVRQHVELNVDDSLLADAQECERYAELFAAVCEAADAFIGWAAHTPVLRQAVDLRRRSRAAGAAPPYVPGGAKDEIEHLLPDVHWLDYFGPAFVERWGERLDDVGVRRDRTPSGGVLVWSTPTPFVLDETVTRIDGYAWKRPFYSALGDSAFLHEGMTEGARGEHVPTLDEHRAHLRRA